MVNINHLALNSLPIEVGANELINFYRGLGQATLIGHLHDGPGGVTSRFLGIVIGTAGSTTVPLRLQFRPTHTPVHVVGSERLVGEYEALGTGKDSEAKQPEGGQGKLADYDE